MHVPLHAVVWTTYAAFFMGCASTPAAFARDSTHAFPPRRAAHEYPTEATVEGAAVLNKDVFIRNVLTKNPSIESARQAWRAALAGVVRTGVLDDPMVDVGLAPLSIDSSNAPVGYSVGVSQKLPWFGKRTLEKTIAAAEAAAAKSDLETTRRDLALTSALLYDQYFLIVRSLEINEAHVALVKEFRAAATAQFEAGRGSAQDLLQAEVELTHMEHDALRLASERDVLVAQMNELLHRDPDLPLPPPPKERPLPPEVDTPDRKQWETETVNARPEIAAAREHVRAEEARADRALREWYPDVTVSTSYNSMWTMSEHRWMVGLGFNLPIQGGRRTGAADEAKAARARFESEVERLSAKARVEVIVGLKQLAEAHHVVVLYEQRLLPVAREQVAAARNGFVASQNPFVAVIDAEKNLRSVELGHQMARTECDRRHAELERALGRIPGEEEDAR